jgi:signal transduction histidine kinase
VIEEVTSVVAPILNLQEQTLTTSIDEAPAVVEADPRRLGQVLINLISNASEHSGPGSPVLIRVAPQGTVVRVAVADRGPSLPEIGAAAAMQPFGRQTAALSPANEAAGLGLAVARWIIEAHGGRVGASNRPGGGARFWFELPKVEAA